MRLDRLLGDVDVLEWRGHPSTTEVDAITHDSRRAGRGALFCCLRGERTDGHDFAAAAVSAGAAALVCERPLAMGVPQAVVADARAAMAPAAAALFGHPSRALDVVGVTGTNGKTTVAHLVAAAFEAGGRPTGVIGTLTGARTTPEAPELQRRLADLRREGMTAAAMEVSSHALAQRRVDAVRFAVGVFTNLGQDHLDYHGDVDDYFEAKARLFEPGRCELGVVNADDPFGRRLIEHARIPVRPFSATDAVDVRVDRAGSRFRWRGVEVALRLGGRFNVVNAVAAATVVSELGVPDEEVARGLGALAAVPGRFEAVDAGQPFTVIVDYAHTPQGLEQALLATREMVGRGRVSVVFGCGGERERDKRPLMGGVASRLADRVVLTTDNPRHEDPLAIIEETKAGLTRDDIVVVEPDRRAAIARAIVEARPGDVVLVAGKGHEVVQVVGDRTVPFDDRVVVRELLGGASW